MQVAAWVPDMICNFYQVKNHKLINNATTSKAIEKITTDLESIYFYNFFGACLTKSRNNQILHKKLATNFQRQLGYLLVETSPLG
jgi:hypothetical protein